MHTHAQWQFFPGVSNAHSRRRIAAAAAVLAAVCIADARHSRSSATGREHCRCPRPSRRCRRRGRAGRLAPRLGPGRPRRITGHLDEYHPTFGDAWKGFRINSTNAAADGTGWPSGTVRLLLDGLVRLGCVLHDNALLAKAEAALWSDRRGRESHGHVTDLLEERRAARLNSWAHSQMGRALVAWYEATGDKRILNALVRAYSHYPVPMGHMQFDHVSGLCNLDALLETYALSGDRRLLERARAAVAAADVQAPVRDWLAGRFIPGHAVSTYEQIRLPALFFLATGEPKYLQASRNAWQWIDQNHLLPYGVASGEEFMSGRGALPPHRNLQRDGQHLVHALALSPGGRAPGVTKSSRPSSTPPPRRSRGISRRCAITSRPTASRPNVAQRAARLPRPWLPALQPARLSAGPLLVRHRQPHRARITSCTCGWPRRTTDWRQRSMAPRPSLPGLPRLPERRWP